MASKAMDLFDAYSQDKLPKDEGYIVSSFFSPNSAYSIYEIVSYAGVKAIFVTGDGLTFQSNGKKLFILIEPPNYPHKAIEPYCRSSNEQIPLRFNELDIHVAKNQTKIMQAKKAVMSYSSFTVLKPTGVNFSLVFYKLPDLFDTLKIFFEKTFNKEAGVPQHDAQKVAAITADKVRTQLSWSGLENAE